MIAVTVAVVIGRAKMALAIIIRPRNIEVAAVATIDNLKTIQFMIKYIAYHQINFSLILLSIHYHHLRIIILVLILMH